MQVKRIVANTQTPEPDKAKAFYGDLLGLDLLMDMGFIQTYGSAEKMTVQISFAQEGGGGTAVPDLSIEVGDLDEAIAKFEEAQIPFEYGPVTEPWGVRRFYVRDPFGKLVNILQHG
ncbi:Glyoxalase-like domain protein [Bremerella volcania]|uniref:Glyoxalase-like domain protein n=1 Tax=Bremerella volcania TaxID=2527984 RepID=A0A518C633_9BACT|nr:VOC family protein [Bremerella volcania]QDU74696.1 Glyoxalase-like domain protein [Bremerella volcania]